MSTPEAPPAEATRIPTHAELEQELTQLILQRAALKDQLEILEKQIPVLGGQVQLLAAQEQAVAEAITD